MQVEKPKMFTTLALGASGALLGVGTEVLQQRRYCKMDSDTFEQATKHLGKTTQEIYSCIKDGFAKNATEEVKLNAKKLAKAQIGNMGLIGFAGALLGYFTYLGAKTIYNHFAHNDNKNN